MRAVGADHIAISCPSGAITTSPPSRESSRFTASTIAANDRLAERRRRALGPEQARPQNADRDDAGALAVLPRHQRQNGASDLCLTSASHGV
jgi:hypothetical protein